MIHRVCHLFQVSDQDGGVSPVERTALYVFSKIGSKVSMNVLKNSAGYLSGPPALLFFKCLIASLISSCEIVLSREALCWSDKRLNKVVSERKESMSFVLGCLVAYSLS